MENVCRATTVVSGVGNEKYNTDAQGPDEEMFTAGMKNLVLHTAPPSLFGSLMTVLAPNIR